MSHEYKKMLLKSKYKNARHISTLPMSDGDSYSHEAILFAATPSNTQGCYTIVNGAWQIYYVKS